MDYFRDQKPHGLREFSSQMCTRNCNTLAHHLAKSLFDCDLIWLEDPPANIAELL